MVLDDLKNVLEDKLSVKLPDYSTWRIQKLDICYAWQFRSNEEAHLALSLFKTYLVSRKNQHVWDTTIKHKGFSSSTIFYLKHEEFHDNDYKELKLWGDLDLAEEVFKMSVGVLRVKVTMRKQKLDALFHQDIFFKDIIDKEKIYYLLRDHLSDVTHPRCVGHISLGFNFLIQYASTGILSPRSSSGLGQWVFSPLIAGSNPARGTHKKSSQ